MRWPIRLQIFVPFAALLVVSVVGGALLSSQVAAQRAGALEVQRLSRVVAALTSADFPYSAAVLQRMRGLSGAEFVTIDSTGRTLESTVPGGDAITSLPEIPALTREPALISDFPRLQLGSETYFVSAVDTPAPRALVQRLYVLYPRETWERLQWDAAWPPLAIGVLTLLLMLGVSGWLAHRIGSRIDVVRRLFGELEAGRFPQLPAPAMRDELATLIDSANELSSRLEALQREVARTERLRLLAQIAGGFAHQLRNAITGARLAVQLHQQECPAAPGDDCLETALAQLSLTEQQVRSLLSLSREPVGPPQSGELRAILRDVERLVAPHARHRQLALQFDDRLSQSITVVDAETFRGAVMNLVLNALEAVGLAGSVRVESEATSDEVRVRVIDSGSGPADAVRDRLFEPFVTTKPEGVGLGLMLAQQAAEQQGGQLTWSRSDGLTVFTVAWPRTIGGGPMALRPIGSAATACSPPAACPTS